MAPTDVNSSPSALARWIDDHPRLAPLRDAVARRMGADLDPGHDLEHALRVASWTCRLDPTLDRTEAVAAALLHDVVNLPKDHPERASAGERSADLARQLMARQGFDAAAIDRVAEAIAAHGYSRGVVPESPLGRALQDADRLEALGALGLCRTLSTGARMGARYFHPRDPWAMDRPLDDRAFTVDHFYTKLLKLPDTLLTEAGRTEARRRARFLEGFLMQLRTELE